MSNDTHASSTITDHPFAPVKDWFSLCRVCRLAESAHATTSIPVAFTRARYANMKGQNV